MRFVLTVPAVLLATAVSGAEPDRTWYFTLYLQESFPKQTNTNKQIQQINDTFGVNFNDWGDVHNLSLGAQLFKRVSPLW